MIKEFIQKHKAIFLAVVIIAVATSAVAFGYLVIKNEKKNANQKVETLQKSIEDLQSKSEQENIVKNEEQQEISKEPEKDIPVEEAAIQQTPTAEKSVVVAPIKTEEAEEKIVSCVAFDGTTLRVSEDECDEIKQKNVIAERAIDKYDDCISDAENYLSDAKEKYDNRMDSGYSASIVADYNSSIGEYNNMTKECVDERNNQLKKLK
ncbi:hypothetical protein [Desulfobacter postgatei]|jgi:hypothetical protein|uniref:hypothetical protein n=1 Tax=Desulfobacter postgatei TaxID=2293 RepID=UPI002A369800|nr:hypothetical protein [Desulfobacter postgatei]MDX9964266.1 hypothetical protein [Desulfobacter postgatei]